MDTIGGGLDARVALLACGLSCAIDARTAADLQLDVINSGLIDTDRVRVCIEDVLIHETTVGHGRIAVAGLPSGIPLNITVNGLSGSIRSGQTLPTSLGIDSPWAEIRWEVCTDDCTPCTIENPQTASTDENGHLLAIHFIE